MDVSSVRTRLDGARRAWRKSTIKRAYLTYGYEKLYREWVLARRPSALSGIRSHHTVPPAMAIIPADPVLLRASKGDDAMLSVLIETIRSHNVGARIVIATGSETADRKVRELDLEPVRLFGRGIGLSEASKRLLAHNPTHLFLMGADVLDGSYDPRFSLRLLAVTDLAARNSVVCSITGFSFSRNPFPGLKRVYAEITSAVMIHLRDPISHRRFSSFSTAESKGVADIAFLLHPDRSYPALGSVLHNWIENRKEAKRIVIGVNIHPLLLSDQPHISVPNFISAVGGAVAAAIRDESVSVVLISHDFRGSAADRNLLDPLQEVLLTESANDVYYIREELEAAELKALTSRLDGVISGRMHLAIASLGAGTPVLGLNYKDKMEGLFEHFDLARDYAVPVQDAVRPDVIESAVRRFVHALPSLTSAINAELPHVTALADTNFTVLTKQS